MKVIFFKSFFIQLHINFQIFRIFSGDAREIVNSGQIEIVKIPLKGKATSGEYNCLICPLTQGHNRGFKRKEDMKRHNQLHFKVRSCFSSYEFLIVIFASEYT